MLALVEAVVVVVIFYSSIFVRQNLGLSHAQLAVTASAINNQALNTHMHTCRERQTFSVYVISSAS